MDTALLCDLLICLIVFIYSRSTSKDFQEDYQKIITSSPESNSFLDNSICSISITLILQVLITDILLLLTVEN
jgi:hypothetical protein